jgi:hypothetical protein
LICCVFTQVVKKFDKRWQLIDFLSVYLLYLIERTTLMGSTTNYFAALAVKKRNFYANEFDLNIIQIFVVPPITILDNFSTISIFSKSPL